jgi:hypothetical protein
MALRVNLQDISGLTDKGEAKKTFTQQNGNVAHKVI